MFQGKNIASCIHKEQERESVERSLTTLEAMRYHRLDNTPTSGR